MNHVSLLVEGTGVSSQRGAAELPSLDGIRAVSVLLVLVSHTGFGRWVPGGLGVTVFFFLSGLLITHLLTREYDRAGRISISDFYLRRFFRLMPPLIVTLSIAYTLSAVGALGGQITARGILAQVFYYANYFYLFFDGLELVPHGTSVLWSLSVEEQFYILYPFAVILLLSRHVSRTQVLGALWVVCLGVLAWRCILVYGGAATSDLRTYYATDTRIDSLLYGAILSFMLGKALGRKEQAPLPPGMLALLAASAVVLVATLLVRDERFRETFRYSLQGIALIPIFLAATRYPRHVFFAALNWPAMKAIGRMSYSIYLIHSIVVYGLLENFPGTFASSVVLTISAFAVSLTFALMIEKTLEPYFRQLRARHRH